MEVPGAAALRNPRGQRWRMRAAAPRTHRMSGVRGDGPGGMTVVSPIRPRRRILAGAHDQVREARLFVGRALGGCPVADDAVLLVSELATNAIVHTASGQGGKFIVTVYRDDTRARVEVMDDGSGQAPLLRPRENAMESGLGLGLVELVASRWGHWGGPRRRVVWFELDWK